MRPGDRSSGGFTLIELMIVIAIIGIVAAIAIPNLLEARKAANEAAAVAFLRSIHSAQELFRERDGDRDGVPDYALNINDLRTAKLLEFRPANPLAGYREGFYFAVTGEAQDAQWAYNAMAVPVTWEKSGGRNFLTNQSGAIYFSTTLIDFQNPPGPSAWQAIGN